MGASLKSKRDNNLAAPYRARNGDGSCPIHPVRPTRTRVMTDPIPAQKAPYGINIAPGKAYFRHVRGRSGRDAPA